ncbi:cyclic di-GMP phosphodiesterase [Salmonella enterica]|nr:cyclic di-GMP phosphodiesterase [Salmonella enterica]
MLTRDSSSGRKILLTCIITGIAAALLIGSLQFFLSWHKRDVKYNTLLSDVQHYLASYFADLKATTDILQPLTINTCQQVGAELTSRAAFSLNVRAFLLIKDKKVFCSSATGAMNMPLQQLVPDIDIRKDVAMAILPGTPMMPNKPTMVIWYRNPLLNDSGVFTSLNINLTPYLLYTTRQDDFNGIALIVGNTALSTFSSRLLTVAELPGTPSRLATINGLPLKIQLYADSWTYNDLWYALMLGCISGIVAGFICYFIYALRTRPGKEILTAIKHEQFYVVYQPVVDTRTLSVTGLEVLLRWRHPTAGEIPPDAFIHYADINIAPEHLHSDSFKEDMHRLRDALPAHHFHIVLEITERDMLQQYEAAKLFEWLHSAGFEIAIDDFGTGHSALIYLERFTLDYLKIDRGFIQAIGTETVTSPVLDTVLTLSRRLNMLTVAEGVETPDQARWLRDHGVNYLQGYWISRPLPLKDFVLWMSAPSVPEW